MNAQAQLSTNSLVDVVTLVKPRITLLTLITAGAGIYLAPGSASWRVILIALIGIALLVGGANALNMFIERDSDLLMKRTQNRPLPGKRLSPEFVLGFGSLLIGVSIPLLTYYVNSLTGALGALSLVSYVLFYTPLKRKSSLALLVGAVPGAMPPLLGWTAVTGAIGLPALVLFAIIFFWQIPHFLAIGLFRKEEYARAGIRIYTLDASDSEILWQIVMNTVALVAVSLLLIPLHVAGLLYLVTSLFLGGAFLGYALLGFKRGLTEAWAKRLFLISLFYLTGLFSVLFFDGGAL
ncbi:MAG: heme o synthase [Deltaproteobacteria bacterium]|nr:heme o synthase [Deltaproteobacteria bacterium]